MSLRLFTALLLAVLGRAIPLTRPPAAPVPRRLATRFTAIVRSGMPRPEQPFTALEQTTPGPMMTALWPFADVPKKMTLVHGSLYSRCSSLEAKRQLRFEAFISARSSPPSVHRYFTKRANPAIQPGRGGPGQGAFLSRFLNAADNRTHRSGAAWGWSRHSPFLKRADGTLVGQPQDRHRACPPRTRTHATPLWRRAISSRRSSVCWPRSPEKSRVENRVFDVQRQRVYAGAVREGSR